MVSKVDSNKQRLKRHKRVRAKISGTAERPRLNVFRSNLNIYAQIIDDTTGKTLVAAKSAEKAFEGKGGNKDAARKVGQMIAAIFDFLGDLFGSLFRKIFVDSSIKVEGTDDVMSVVGVVGVMSVAVRENFELLLYLAISISANLGVMNLLPLPALDGGRIVFVIAEKILGHRVSPEKEGLVHFIGFALLIAFMLFITFSDVRKLFG